MSGNPIFNRAQQELLERARINDKTVIEALSVIERGTIFATGGAVLNDGTFFTLPTNNRWQSVNFANNSDPKINWVLNKMRMKTTWRSNALTAVQNADHKVFLENSYIQLKNNTTVLPPIPLSSLVNYDMHFLEPSYTPIRRTTDWYNFDDKDVITIEGGSSWEFLFQPYPNQTAGAGVALQGTGVSGGVTGYYFTLEVSGLRLTRKISGI
ncbi:MAG: hypothetical protein JNL36_07645 [Candidatus Kapabacteria bacterium]|nr:hypothetical protein [Candidatus Kapabacteria bacterium]